MPPIPATTRARKSASQKTLLAKSHALSRLRVCAALLAHEGVHLVRADVDELEAALRRELLHLGVGVERGPELGEPPARLRRRRLRHADAAVGYVQPLDAELAESTTVRLPLIARGDS